MKYAYPAIFTPAAEGGYDVKVPDLPGCRTCGDDLADAIFMAEDAISMWLWAAENKNEVIPAATRKPEKPAWASNSPPPGAAPSGRLPFASGYISPMHLRTSAAQSFPLTSWTALNWSRSTTFFPALYTVYLHTL